MMEALAAFRAAGNGACELLSGLTQRGPLGAPGANGRAVMEDVEHCLALFAQAEPAVLLDAVGARPELLSDFAFVSALRNIEGERADQLLLEVLKSKSGALRWLSLEALIARKQPAALQSLERATRDRDSLVRFAAVVALRRFGQASDLPRLLEIFRAAKTAPGTREYARDAIEAISARAGLALPEGMAPRLVELLLPADAEPCVMRSSLVEAGAALTRTRGQPSLVAPFRAVVVDVVLERETRLVVLRREPLA
jgi:HEAT repeat protein